MTDAWPTIRHFASAASLTTFAVGGAKTVLAGYQTFASPCTSLTESEKKLKRVRSQLQRLSPKRREEIEIAIRSNATDCKSLKDLEEQLDGLLDMFCRLSMRYEESTFAERHFPYSQFRNRVSKLEHLAKALLNDTLTTIVPYIDDIGFDPKKSMWEMAGPSSPELEAFLIPSALSPNADVIPMSRFV
ncbi:hypothetical protein BJV77DRAFT_1147793 [Russula vinacea]|nr:hypothetical protein BJV77DRAFT_1147793 [Russula vinacea]